MTGTRRNLVRAALFAGAALGATATATACGDDGGGTAPRIDMLAPTSAAVGGDVEILGGRFCGPAATDVGGDDTCASPPDGFVTFGVTDAVLRAQVKSWKGTRITVGVPAAAPAGVSTVTVTVNGVSSNVASFTVTE
jgi:hypothetical protein